MFKLLAVVVMATNLSLTKGACVDDVDTEDPDLCCFEGEPCCDGTNDDCTLVPYDYPDAEICSGHGTCDYNDKCTCFNKADDLYPSAEVDVRYVGPTCADPTFPLVTKGVCSEKHLFGNELHDEPCGRFLDEWWGFNIDRNVCQTACEVQQHCVGFQDPDTRSVPWWWDADVGGGDRRKLHGVCILFFRDAFQHGSPRQAFPESFPGWTGEGTNGGWDLEPRLMPALADKYDGVSRLDPPEGARRNDIYGSGMVADYDAAQKCIYYEYDKHIAAELFGTPDMTCDSELYKDCEKFIVNEGSERDLQYGNCYKNPNYNAALHDDGVNNQRSSSAKPALSLCAVLCALVAVAF